MNGQPSKSYTPLVILGAGRSGTNMLRDLLIRLNGVVTWPCDEINYIWRHGNMLHPNDEFQPCQATDRVSRYIRRAFDRVAIRSVRFVVEKTCANTLRVGFVSRVLPDAKYICIVRDGRDVVASSLQRWTARLDLSYILRKARFVPLMDLPYYGGRYCWNRLYRLASRQERLAFWGPRFAGLEKMLATHSLPEVCAAQWARCVERADAELAQVDPGSICRVRYEDFVHDPSCEFRRLCEFLQLDVSPATLSEISRYASTASVGNWRRALSPDAVEAIRPITAATLQRHGYAASA